MKPVSVRFWEKVDQSGGPAACWTWKARTNRGGYGYFRVGSKALTAHRVSYEMAYGLIPQGMLVCHRCDNPPCVNPAHLWLGTEQDNTQDSVQKGRRARQYGAANGFSRFSEADISEIRRAAASGALQKDIAHRFGVDRSTISYILTGKTWRHVA